MYVVVENIPGYMPESDPVSFTDLTLAQGYAESLAQGYRDTWGKMRDKGRIMVQKEGERVWMVLCPDKPHDLGRVIEIMDADPGVGCGCSNCCC